MTWKSLWLIHSVSSFGWLDDFSWLLVKECLEFTSEVNLFLRTLCLIGWPQNCPEFDIKTNKLWTRNVDHWTIMKNQSSPAIFSLDLKSLSNDMSLETQRKDTHVWMWSIENAFKEVYSLESVKLDISTVEQASDVIPTISNVISSKEAPNFVCLSRKVYLIKCISFNSRTR